MRAALAKHGHRVFHAPDAETAFKNFRKPKLDLIILDMTLPGMSGLEFLRILRSESQIPVVLMSGRLTATHRATGLKLGAHDCLHKPFTIPELLACVKRARGASVH